MKQKRKSVFIGCVKIGKIFFSFFLQRCDIPTSTPEKPRKRFYPSMFTSPDGKGVIMGGGFILDGWSKVYLTSLIELRLNGTSNEFYWTNINQTMKIPREGPVIFTVPDDYCIQPDILSLSEHASVTWIRLTITGGLIIVALVSIIAYAARRHWINIKEIKSKKRYHSSWNDACFGILSWTVKKR